MLREELLRDLASLTHARRQRRMVDLGEIATAGASVGAGAAAVLSELREGNGYERRLALQAGWGSRDPAVAARGLVDPSRLARAAARRLAAVLCDDAHLSRSLEDSPPPARRALLVQMRERRRWAALDAFLQGLADRADPAFGPLLAYGSGAFVARHLPGAAETAAGLNWRALARAHPRATAAWLSGAVRAAAELDGRLAAQARAALPVLSERLPDAAVDLAGGLARHVPLASLPLQALVGRRPEAVADLCLAAAESRPVSFVAVAHRLDQGRLSALLARFGGLGEAPGGQTRWLRRLRPERRAAVYDLVGRGWRDADGVVAPAILALLPRPAREAEARRHLALPALATRPMARLPYAGLLPWDEARGVLDPALGDPDPDPRGAALAALAACVRFERGRARDLLALALERRHEQDPVRGALLRGMADLPPGVWQADHLDGLGAVVRQALDAADLSAGSAGQIGRLLAGQLPRHPDWAAGWLAVLARERGALVVPGLGRLREQDIRRLAPALTPVLHEWALRERDGPLLGLAAELGRRLLPAWDGLVALVERVVQHGTAGSAAAALRVLARHRPDRLHHLVPRLLQDDPSWATQAPVYDHLHRRRQDLLTPFLGRTAYEGRFATGRTCVVLPFRGGFERWTPEQQDLFAASLRGVIADEARDGPALLGAIARLAALPDTRPDVLERLAGPDEPRPAAREAALRGLGRRDDGDGLPVLLAALDDARARIAAYALRRSVLEMPLSRALGVLRGVPRRKVTVAKEVVRLVGELPGEEAYGWLLALDAQDRATGLHRDVRVALLRALWGRLERDETWAAFERAVGSPDPAVATAAARVPGEALSPGADGRLAGLLAALLAHPDPRVRVHALGRCATQPLADRGEALLAPLLRALASPLPDECRLAASAVFSTYVGRRAARVGEAARAVRAHRFALSVLAAELRHRAGWARERHAATVRAVLDALGDDPALAGLCAELAASALPAGALIGHFQGAVGTLHAGALARAVAALEGARGLRLDDVAAIEAALCPARDERLRRLALAALCAQAAGLGRGWTAERIARLEAFRTDPSPLVAEAARFTFPPAETGAAGDSPEPRRRRGTRTRNG